MGLLSSMWHQIGPVTVNANTGGAAIGAVYAGYQHSLLTTPDLVVPVLRSVAVGNSANNAGGLAGLFALPGNASQATIGYGMGSVASFPVICFDLYAAYIWSGAR